MADRTPPPKRDLSWGKISKTLSLWIIVILIPIVFMQVNGARDQTTEIERMRGMLATRPPQSNHQ